MIDNIFNFLLHNLGLTSSLPLLKIYQNSFMKIVYDYKEKGLNNETGLQNELRDVSKLIDIQIEKTIKQLDLEIQENIINTIIIIFHNCKYNYTWKYSHNKKYSKRDESHPKTTTSIRKNGKFRWFGSRCCS